MWIAAGEPLLKVAKWAGHRPEITLSTYARLFEEREADKAGVPLLDVPEAVRRVRSRYEGGSGELAARRLDVPAPREADGAF
jgi:hypothetical protein